MAASLATPKMTQDKNYKILDETDELILGHVFERAYLTIKATNENLSLGDFYGDPTCGLISRANDWCVIGGSTLLVWTRDEIATIKDNDTNWASDIRQITENKVELLIDPWADNSAIWEFDIITKEKNKIKDFTDYKDKEYTDNVVW